MTTPHARHLAEMRATTPRQPVDVLPVVVSHLRDLVPCATRRHLLEMRVLAVLADGEWHRDEEVGVVRDTCASDELLVLCVLRYRGDVSYVPGLGWRLARGAA